MAELQDHPFAQVLVVAALRRRDLVEAETALQRVVFVQAVERHEFRIHQRGARGVLAVVGQGVAVAVEDFRGAGLAHAQPRPDDGAAERGQPPFLGHVADRVLVHAGSASDSSHSRPAQSRATRMTTSAMRAGVARPVNADRGRRDSGR